MEELADRGKQPGESTDEAIEDHVALTRRHAFEAEARRQCLLVNPAARDPDSNEAAVMAELATLFDADDFGAEWKA